MGTTEDGTAAGTRLERREVEVPAGRISLREAGAGETIIFAHGWGANGDLWTATAERLATTHHVIVPDWPWGSQRIPLRDDADLSPFGAARIVADVIEVLDLDGVTVVANDAGGAVSQLVVVRHPERIGKLVLTNCDALDQCPPDEFKPLVKSLRFPGVGLLVHRVFAIRGVQRSRFGYGRLSRERISDEMLDSFRRPSVEDKAVFRDSMKFARDIGPEVMLEAATKFGDVRIPVLLVWGDADPFFTMDLGRRLETLFADARLVTVPGAKCFVPLDDPDRLAAEVTAFVATGEPAAQVS